MKNFLNSFDRIWSRYDFYSLIVRQIGKNFFSSLFYESVLRKNLLEFLRFWEQVLQPAIFSVFFGNKKCQAFEKTTLFKNDFFQFIFERNLFYFSEAFTKIIIRSKSRNSQSLEFSKTLFSINFWSSHFFSDILGKSKAKLPNFYRSHEN